MEDLVVLGSTGSIGTQTLDVVSRHPDKVRITGLAAKSSFSAIVAQARRFGVGHIALADEQGRYDQAVREAIEDGITVDFGPAACERMAASDTDIVLNALVGEAGMRSSYAALASGHRLALANKESLVVGGDLIMSLAKSGGLLPVDSEHSAIFQCLIGERHDDIARIWITASGGPFLGWNRERLATVSREEALAHPTWKMGPKITIDSATLMNKGLEVIEAHHLFDVPIDDICAVVHPQSRIHSMVEFRDGSVKADLGAADMRVPIQFALSYPDRWEAPGDPVDWRTVADLSFRAPDALKFRCFSLALQAGRTGGTAPCILNASNEVAVQAFLQGRCSFTDIDYIVETALDAVSSEPVESLEQLEAIDTAVRIQASDTVSALGH